MPVIDGVKMACAPCIRGHRSTKCQHNGERVLVAVRKPGRPLSVCPHPTDKSCGCGVITAAIPRSKKCGCGTSAVNGSPTEKPSVNSELADLVPELKSPTSPTKRHFSIQKSTPKQTTKIDPTLLERADASYMNVRPALSWNGLAMPPNQNGFVTVMPAQGAPVSFAPPGSSVMVNGFHQPTASVVVPYNGQGYVMATPTQREVMAVSLPVAPPGLMSADHGIPRHSHQGNGSVGIGPSTTTNNGVSGSCCGSKATPHHSPSSSTNSATVPSKSCCSSASTAEPGNMTANHGRLDAKSDIQHTVNGNYANASVGDVQLHGIPLPRSGPHVDASVMPSFEPPLSPPEMVFPTGFYHQPPGPAIYTYPPSYGTMQSPLQPAQWRQTMSAHYAMGMPNQHGLAHQPAMLPYHSHENSTVDGGGVSHACSCGGSCNCVGCPAHPYNEATQGMVRSAMSSMLHLDSPEAVAPGPGANGAAGAVASGTAPSSPTPAHTPASEKSEDQVQAEASQFFFVNYPPECGGAENTCPCGDDCQCLGCFIHGNSGELDSDFAGATGGHAIGHEMGTRQP